LQSVYMAVIYAVYPYCCNLCIGLLYMQFTLTVQSVYRAVIYAVYPYCYNLCIGMLYMQFTLTVAICV